GDRNDAENGRVVAAKGVGIASSGDGCGNDTGNIDTGATGGTELIDGLVVDTAAVIGALVEVPIALINAAEGEEVIALKDADVIANHVVVTIREAGAGALGVDVVGRKSVAIGRAEFAERLESAPETSKLRWIGG